VGDAVRRAEKAWTDRLLQEREQRRSVSLGLAWREGPGLELSLFLPQTPDPIESQWR